MHELFNCIAQYTHFHKSRRLAMSSTENVLELGWVLWGLNYANVAVTTIWAYDSFLTMADEVAFLMQSQWKWGKLLYVVCRYLTCGYLTSEMLEAFQPMLSIHTCQVIYSMNTYLGGFIVVCAEGVFLFRVCAIWGFKRSVVILFSISALVSGRLQAYFNPSISDEFRCTLLLPV